MRKKIDEIMHDRSRLTCLVIVLIGFAIFAAFYLDNRILGDQLGLWSYISAHNYQNPFTIWDWKGSLGVPHFLNPEYSFLDISYFIQLFFKDIILKGNIINAVHALLIGIGMFLLCNHLTKSFNAALIGAISTLFSGAAIKTIGADPYYFAIAYVSFIFYFTLKLLDKPNYKYSFFLAVSFTFLVLSGGISTLLWLIFYLPIFFLLYFIFFFDKNKIQKQALFLVIAFVLFVSFSLFKIWSGYEYIQDAGVRSAAQPYELFMQGRGAPKEWIPKLESMIIPTKIADYRGLWIGPIGAILVAFSLLNVKKRKYLLFFIIMLIAILTVSDTIFSIIAHKIPYINRLKDIVKSLFIFSVSFGVVASFGYLTIEKLLKNKKYVAQIILSLVVLQFVFFFVLFNNMDMSPHEGLKGAIQKDTFFDEIKNEKGFFRLSYVDFIGGLIAMRIWDKNIESADWMHGNGFSVPFVTFKQVANSVKTEELLGLLNVKYVYSIKPLENNKLSLIKKENSEYLYKNNAFLPRYREIKKAILVYEDKNNMQSSYSILASPLYDVSNSAIISLESIENEDLKKYDAIFVAKDPNQNEIKKLSEYSKKGIIFPDIFAANKNITPQEYLETIKEPYFEMTKVERGRDKLLLYAENPGWIILSDTFSIYSGWEAGQDGKELAIYRANGINTAVYAQKTGWINFKYRPKPFYFGGAISAVSFLIALAIFIFSDREL